jgi:preprotein translocase subunit SecA
VPIEHRFITRAIENAQKKVEAHNFDIRKHLLEYDDVMNKQREVIYHRRRQVLAGEFLVADEEEDGAAADGESPPRTIGLKDEVLSMARDLAEGIVASVATRELPPAEWNWKGLSDALFKQFSVRFNLPAELRGPSATERAGNGGHELADLSPERLQEAVLERIARLYEAKEQLFTAPVMRHLERVILLQTIDALWKDHLLAMDHLKEGVGLRGYGQVNPLQEYKKEGFEMFEEMIGRIQEDAVQRLFTVQLAREEAVREAPVGAEEGAGLAAAGQTASQGRPVQRMFERFEQERRHQQVVLSHGGAQEPRTETIRRQGEKTGRNDPCPCGSGKKYKRCHGK